MQKLITITTCSLLIGIGFQASAYYDSQSELFFEEIHISEVSEDLNADSLIAVGEAGNAKTELDFINDILNTNYTQASLDIPKIEFTESNPEDNEILYTEFFYWVDDGIEDNANIWAFQLPDEPVNFTIKTGGKDQYLWIYENNPFANWGVIQEGSLPTSQLAFLSITETMLPGSFTLNNGDITSISHVAPRGTSVPEPEMMLLFGTGIVGIAGVAMRRKKK